LAAILRWGLTLGLEAGLGAFLAGGLLLTGAFLFGRAFLAGGFPLAGVFFLGRALFLGRGAFLAGLFLKGFLARARGFFFVFFFFAKRTPAFTTGLSLLSFSFWISDTKI
jgi:hypothetical protein